MPKNSKGEIHATQNLTPGNCNVLNTNKLHNINLMGDLMIQRTKVSIFVKKGQA